MRPGLFPLERGSSPRYTSHTRFPCRGGPRQRGLPDRRGLGKLIGRSPSEAGPPTRSRPAQLGLITDEISRHQCLLETGSQVSLWPPSPTSLKVNQSRVRLTAANGTPIRSFGQQRRQIKIGGKQYSFIFLIAQISRPILGLDFLQTFAMTIDLRLRHLIHSGVSTCLSSASSEISGINVVHAPSPFTHLLQEFPEVVDASLAANTSRHGVECFIETTGPPIKTLPRRLTPEKLKIAKQYFEMMCAAGICRCSDSPWSSGLHMVAKKDRTTRPCRDYRRLNEHTSGDAYPIPHIHDFAADLAGCQIFSKIDLVFSSRKLKPVPSPRENSNQYLLLEKTQTSFFPRENPNQFLLLEKVMKTLPLKHLLQPLSFATTFEYAVFNLVKNIPISGPSHSATLNRLRSI